MARMKKNRRKDPANHSDYPRHSKNHYPQFIISIVAFLLSGIFFVHQCLLPQNTSTIRPHFSPSSPSSTHHHHHHQPQPISIAVPNTQGNPKSQLRNDQLQSTQSTVDSNEQQQQQQQQHHHHHQPKQKQKQFGPKVISSNTLSQYIPPPPASIADSVAQANLEKIPKGPYPLPSLTTSTTTANTEDHDKSSSSSSTEAVTKPKEQTVQAGSTWTVSLARGLVPSLPVHWVAEVSRAASAFAASLTSSSSSTTLTSDRFGEYSSIFTARRKGEWIGCTKPHHTICKGVYRAIKAHNVLSLLSLTCDSDTEWLPHILRKLKNELRPVRLYCALPEKKIKKESAPVEDFHDIRKLNIERMYKDNGLVAIVTVKNIRMNNNEFIIEQQPQSSVASKKQQLNNINFQVDMIVIYRLLSQMNLIDGVRFLRAIKKSQVANLLTTETFSELDNSGKNNNQVTKINVGAAPYLFPAPVFEYVSDEDEKSKSFGLDSTSTTTSATDSNEMEIVVVQVNELFSERMTPEMKDLIDPRKRMVLE